MKTAVQYTWFIGMLIGLLLYLAIGLRTAVVEADLEPAGKVARKVLITVPINPTPFGHDRLDRMSARAVAASDTWAGGLPVHVPGVHRDPTTRHSRARACPFFFGGPPRFAICYDLGADVT